MLQLLLDPPQLACQHLPVVAGAAVPVLVMVVPLVAPLVAGILVAPVLLLVVHQAAPLVAGVIVLLLAPAAPLSHAGSQVLLLPLAQVQLLYGHQPQAAGTVVLVLVVLLVVPQGAPPVAGNVAPAAAAVVSQIGLRLPLRPCHDQSG